jgi:4-hydroxy-tetrahydrodipicolinate synthase
VTQLQLEGVLPALITPFSDDGTAVDDEALAELVERCVTAGAGGLVPAGSTGEFTTLSMDERRHVVELVIAAADDRVPTIPGTGALSTTDTIDLSVHAEAAGAAAVMIVPPFYTPLSWEELLAHFEAVADRISIPIMYYNLPDASGVRLTTEQWAELAKRARVTSLKDTGGDSAAATELFQRPAGMPTILNGYDTMTFNALAAGVRAVVWGVASFIPEACVELHRLLVIDTDLVAARELWARIWPICDFLESTSYAPAVKAACRITGQRTGPVRAPLLELGDDEQRRLAALIDALAIEGAPR